MIESDLASELIRMAERLRATADRLIGSPANPSGKATPEAIRRANEGVCLSCDNAPKKRGLCENCYQKALRAMSNGRVTEAGLIAEGLLLPPGKVGRKSAALTRIDEFLGSVDRIPGEPPVTEHPKTSGVLDHLHGDTTGQKSGHEKKGGRRKASNGK